MKRMSRVFPHQFIFHSPRKRMNGQKMSGRVWEIDQGETPMDESTGVEDARKRTNDKINSPDNEREYILFLFR